MRMLSFYASAILYTLTYFGIYGVAFHELYKLSPTHGQLIVGLGLVHIISSAILNGEVKEFMKKEGNKDE